MHTISSKVITVMVVLLLGGGVAAGTLVSSATAAAPSADLRVTGSVAGSERNVESSHPVVFVFSLKNNGPSTVDSSADMGYTSVRNGTVTDQLCVFPNGNSFNADSPFCEFGLLRSGQVAHMTLIVQPRSGVTGVKLSARVCSSNESDIPDPVSSNNCTTKSVLY
jgi:Domain of unknown function DUF11